MVKLVNNYYLFLKWKYRSAFLFLFIFIYLFIYFYLIIYLSIFIYFFYFILFYFIYLFIFLFIYLFIFFFFLSFCLFVFSLQAILINYLGLLVNLPNNFQIPVSKEKKMQFNLDILGNNKFTSKYFKYQVNHTLTTT